MKKYVLYGAGNYGRMILSWLSADNVDYFIDNSKDKQGKTIEGIRIYSLEEKKHELKNHIVVVSANVNRDSDMVKSLLNAGINDFLTYKEIEKTLITERLDEAKCNIKVYDKAITWIYNNTIDHKGIINNTGQRNPYPEVTGYYIPTLLNWGHKELAMQYARWLCSIQKKDGCWYGSENDAPYVFDTAQIVKGLLSIRKLCPEVDDNIKLACDWLVSHIDAEGRMFADNENIWGDNKTLSELIHIYCLSPIRDAGIVFSNNNYIDLSYKSLNYYIDNYTDEILNFNLLSHFYAYIIEGLIDMDRKDLAQKAMDRISLIQKDTGAVPAYKNVDWVCSTGLFQFALIWYRLGDIEHSEKAFSYACNLQNKSGGWFGSYISEENLNEDNTYLPINEISWAVKYFLDALHYRNKVIFDHRKDFYIDIVDKKSSVYKIVYNTINSLEVQNQQLKVADVGCGRGSYLKNLVVDYPRVDFYGIDISQEVLKTIHIDQIKKIIGNMTNLPIEDDYFDIVYACESLEHVIDEKTAIKELARVTKNNGYIVIIDKHIEALGEYVIERWEKFFDIESIKKELLKYCSSVDVVNNIGHIGCPDTMTAWIGKVMK